MDIIDFLTRNNSLTLDQYKYIVSRKRHSFDKEEWKNQEKEIITHIDSIGRRINSFGRRRDSKDEDGRKELLKYLLGIRADIPADKDTNIFNICKFNRKVTAINSGAVNLMAQIYHAASEYKLQKYKDLFEECEDDLRRRYIFTVGRKKVPISNHTKIHWDLYNIYPDKFIMLSVIICMACIKNNIKDIDKLTDENADKIIEFAISCHHDLLRNIGVKKESKIRKEIIDALSAIRGHNYKLYTQNITEEKEVLAYYKKASAADIKQKIEELSAKAYISITSERERNIRLVGAMKSYYMKVFSHNDTLKCECCGNEAFITNAGEPYVEFHHFIPFNIAYGPDHYLNLFALCPVCHRKIHHINDDKKKEVYDSINKNNFLQKSFVERLLELKEKNLLRSYHLEYLFSEKAITQEQYDKLAV